MRGPVLLLLAVTPRGSLGSQPPCLLLPLPLLLPGLKRLTGQRAAKQGDPAPRHHVTLPVPATLSRYPFPPPHPEGTDRDPRGRRGETPPATSSHPKALPRSDLDPQPLQGAAASGTGPEAAGCLSAGGAHQNSRKQMFTSCIVLGFSSGDTGCILPACGVGVSAGHM